MSYAFISTTIPQENHIIYSVSRQSTTRVSLGAIIRRWHHKQMAHVYGSTAVLKWPHDCIMLESSIRRVGLVDITAGNATRFGASQRSATRRCASQHIATQRLSRWGSLAARARLTRTLRSIACGSETPAAGWNRGDLTRGRPRPAPFDRPVHAGRPYFGEGKSPWSQRPRPLDFMGSSNAAKLVSTWLQTAHSNVCKSTLRARAGSMLTSIMWALRFGQAGRSIAANGMTDERRWDWGMMLPSNRRERNTLFHR